LGIQFVVKRWGRSIKIRALVPPPGYEGKMYVGYISAGPMNDPCSDAWSIEASSAEINGLGPLLYDLMIDLIHPHPLASDRFEVSPDARRIWDYYRDRRGDIESIQLDDLRNTLTPVEDDNCEQKSAQIWSDDNYGTEDEWPDSSLSKAYRRKGGGTPTLDELQALGIIKIDLEAK
jgi:hypothetical protein